MATGSLELKREAGAGKGSRRGCGLRERPIFLLFVLLAAGERQAGEKRAPFLLCGPQSAGIESERLNDGRSHLAN